MNLRKNGLILWEICGNFQANFVMIGKKQSISWEFSEQISLERDWFCTDLTNVFNYKIWQFRHTFYGKWQVLAYAITLFP